jgi:hypothetical protein
MNRRAYISIPISGTTDYIERGRKLAGRVRAAGYTPILPYESGLPKSAPYPLHMVVDTLLLLTCGTVWFDNAWWGSRGCKWEFKVAVWMGKEIIAEE